MAKNRLSEAQRIVLMAWLLQHRAQVSGLWFHEAAAVVNQQAGLPFTINRLHLQRIEGMLAELPEDQRIRFRKPQARVPKGAAAAAAATADLDARVSRLEATVAKLLEYHQNSLFKV
jgi:hypothetical protein